MASTAVNYRDYMQSQAWKLKRQRRLRRALWIGDHCMCDRCGCFVHRAGIDVHHLTYERLGCEAAEDLAVMCNGCHAVHHGKPAPSWWSDLNGAKPDPKARISRFEAAVAQFLRDGLGEDTALLMAKTSVPIVEAQTCIDGRMFP